MNWKVLFNPFEKYSEKTLLVFGIVTLLIGSLLGYFLNARFDGILDMHIVKDIQWKEPLIDNCINTIILFVFLFAFGKSINSKTRIIDILNVILIARIPIYFISLFNVGGFIDTITENVMSKVDFQNLNNAPQFEMFDIFVLLIFSVASIGFLVWMIVLLWNGFRVSTNSKGIRNKVIFGILILVAEVLSKYLIGTFNF